MKSIREIYESLEKRDETVLFQVKRRSTLNKILNDIENEVDTWFPSYRYEGISIKDIYLCVGKWRLGMAGIFTADFRDKFGDYCFDHYLIDWKSTPSMQYDQEKQVNKFIEIMDRYRSDIKVSKKKYEDFR